MRNEERGMRNEEGVFKQIRVQWTVITLVCAHCPHYPFVKHSVPLDSHRKTPIILIHYSYDSTSLKRFCFNAGVSMQVVQWYE